LERFELVHLQNGVTSLRSLDNLETFHPGVGPQEEACTLHVEQQQVVERAKSCADFVLWDVGLGAAANTLTAIRALQVGLPQEHLSSVTIESFDQTTGPLEFALKNAHQPAFLNPIFLAIIRMVKRKNQERGADLHSQKHSMTGQYSPSLGQ
jgi:hypothetical protein